MPLPVVGLPVAADPVCRSEHGKQVLVKCHRVLAGEPAGTVVVSVLGVHDAVRANVAVGQEYLEEVISELARACRGKPAPAHALRAVIQEAIERWKREQ